MNKSIFIGLALLTASVPAYAEMGKIMLGSDITTLPPSNYSIPEVAAEPIPGKHKSLSGASFYTWMGPCEEEPCGWYSFDTDGTYQLQWTNIFSEIGINLTNGWMRNGRLCGLGVYNMSAMVYYYNYVEFDPLTGQMLKEESITPDNTIDMTTYYESCVYVPSLDKVFGYIRSEDFQIYNFCSSPAGNIGDITVLKTLEYSGDRCNALCYNPEDNTIYGVTFDGDFVSVDYEGNMKVIFHIPLDDVKNAKAALAYSPYDGCYLYTPVYYSYASQLYYLYPDVQEMRFIRNFPSNNEFFFFLNEDYTYNPASLCRPELIKDSIAPGALEGTLTLKMPAKSADGAEVSGSLTWNLYVDNSPVTSGTAEAGAEVSVEIGPLSEGEHVLRICCKGASGVEGLPLVISRYFGNGIPLAPEKVTMTETKVSWTPVDKAELDGYLEAGKMRYEVFINDKFIGSTTDTSMDISLDAEKEVTAYYAYVAASCNGQVSERTKSNKVIFGAPYELPYTVIPTKEQADITEAFNLDGSPDYGTWEFWEFRWHTEVFASGWSYEKADDWLILPPVNCPDLSHAYRVTLDAICGGSIWIGNDERFEVWCGDAPDPASMTTLIMPETKVNNFYEDGFETFSNIFVPKKAGKTYVAIRAVSPPDQYSLVVRNITIEATDEPANVPVAPTNFTVIGKSDADLTATVELTIPTHTITGTEISDEADLRVKAGVGDHWEERSVSPGEYVNMTLFTYQGTNRLVAYCILNGQAGQEISTTIFTGTIPPNYIEDFTTTVSRDNMSVDMTWQPPLGGQENLEGYYSPEGLHYWLMEMVPDEYGEYTWTPTVNLGNVLQYTYTLPADSPLGVKYLGIAAANAAGVSKAIWYAYPELGTPYQPEIIEDFIVGKEAGFNYTPLRAVKVNQDYDSSWELIQPENLDNDAWNPEIPYAMINFSNTEQSGAKGRLQLPKFSSENVKDPALTLTFWTSEPCNVPISVCAATYGAPRMTKIANLPRAEGGWQTTVIPLPEPYRNMPWIQLAIDTDLPSAYQYALLGGYRFGSVDLSSISADQSTFGFIAAGKGEILFVGFEGVPVSVYGLDGRKITSITVASPEEHLSIPKGIYSVLCGERRFKVLVR